MAVNPLDLGVMLGSDSFVTYHAWLATPTPSLAPHEHPESTEEPHRCYVLDSSCTTPGIRGIAETAEENIFLSLELFFLSEVAMMAKWCPVETLPQLIMHRELR